MAGTELPRGSLAILDSSVLIAIGGPSTDKYQAFEQHVTRRNISVQIPDHVAEELGEGPEAYTYQRDRLRAAQNAGWLERAEVDFSNPRVSDGHRSDANADGKSLSGSHLGRRNRED